VSTLEELADRQWRDYRARQPGTCFVDPDFALPPFGGAYELQDAVAKLRIASGDRLIGYKVGCTGPGTVQQFGMQGPIRGCLFESEIRRHGDTLNFEDFANLAIEGKWPCASHPMARSRRRFRSSNCITSYSGDQGRPSPNSLRTMVSMAALSSRTRVGSHRDYTSREEARCLSGLMAVSSRRASYGQYLAALVLRLSGFGSTWQIFGPIYCQDTSFLPEHRSGSTLFTEVTKRQFLSMIRWGLCARLSEQHAESFDLISSAAFEAFVPAILSYRCVQSNPVRVRRRNAMVARPFGRMPRTAAHGVDSSSLLTWKSPSQWRSAFRCPLG
jgi:hypothetical protein